MGLEDEHLEVLSYLFQQFHEAEIAYFCEKVLVTWTLVTSMSIQYIYAEDER